MSDANTDRGNMVVIAVDDQPENLLVLEAVLEDAGYAFMSAASGPECLSLAARCAPRLILLDVQMPQMDGFETCRRLRQLPTLRQTPVAFLTARTSAEDVQLGRAAGGDDFIVKPFDYETLLARVDHWTRRTVSA